MLFGLFIAGIIMITLTFTWSESLDKSFNSLIKFIVSMWPNLLTGILLLFATSHYFGRKAGILILVKNRAKLIVGIGTAFVVLLTSTFVASWVGFIQEGIDNIGTNDNPFEDYIFKPMYWITVFGSIPSLILGGILGLTIRSRGKNYDF
ncbi:hypothetical protein [Ekhidna sp.]|uniref:hypothetical protein n=1 Tax=Ekhidna sp. TaxID=2608089 RepID=UPI003B50CA36